MRYGILNTATKVISKVITGSLATAQMQCGENEVVIPDCPIDATHAVGGVPVKVVTDEEKLLFIRVTRNTLLTACDWTQLPDAPADKAAWGAYRQALRDMPEQCDPDNPIWPIPPA